ncbi:hypothetical protein DFH27DRAFT_522315 [Peziza echinospora]|nr:hypothetical protein DFH27DRAFT_522315 [Peziza echinospora]
MPFLRSSRPAAPARVQYAPVTYRKPSLLSRLMGGSTTRPVTAHTTRVAPAPRRRRRQHGAVVVQKRKPSLKDKISGALLKLKGTATDRPGQKAAGTRRMRGTDGKGQRKRRVSRF